MENALLIGLSRQMALRRKMEIIANNMANMNTGGYKADAVQFEEYLMPVARITAMRGSDARLSYVQDTYLIHDLTEGALRRTGRPLDIAIQGDGWLVVQTPDGERYTRNGQLHRDNTGQLVTSEGYPVLGESGPIVFGPEETGITITPEGLISTNEGEKGRLRLVSFAEPQAMKKVGGTLFRTDEPPQPADTARIVQGAYEQSNVQPVRELTRMIQTTRAYMTTARMVEKMNELRRDAIDKLGTLPT